MAKLCSYSIENLVHRYADGWVGIVFCHAAIQFGPLLVGQRKYVRRSVRFFCDTVPDITDKLKAIRHAQAAIVESSVAHVCKVNEENSAGKVISA